MLLFSIPVLFFLMSVSEAATPDDLGLSIKDTKTNRQRYPYYDEVEDIKEPCADRRALNDRLVHQDSPKILASDTANQRAFVLPAPVKNEEVTIPTERLVPKKQSKPVNKIPDDEISQPLLIRRPDKAQSRSSSKVPVKHNTEQVVPKEINSETVIAPRSKPQLPQNYDVEKSDSPHLTSEEVPEYILKHNEDVPSHKEHHDTIYYAPVHNKLIKPHKFIDPQNSQNLNKAPEPSDVPHSHLTETLKSKTNRNQVGPSEHCNLQPEKPSEDIQESRRSMSQENNESPGLLKLSPSTLRGTKVAGQRKTLLEEPTVLMKPTYQVDPTRGAGIAPLSDLKGHMMESSRVCYACSTLNDASCWLPDRTTTIKYCRQGQEVCVTKSYKNPSGASVIVIRDCSSSCDAETPGLDTHYESCAVCKEDLCNSLNIENSAFSFSPINSIFILICTAFIKYVL